MVTAESVRHEADHEVGTLARLVAEVDGEVVGVARVRDRCESATVMVQVAPSHRRRGVGRSLLDAAVGHAVAAGAREVSSGLVNGDDASQAAAVAWGFELGRRFTISAVDPRTISGPVDGVTVPLGDAGVEAVHAAYVACAGDDPSGLSRSYPLAEFESKDWLLPTHRADLGRAVLADDGAVLAFAMVTVAGERAWNAFTGTVPSARGTGLALRVKHASLLALADSGVTRCCTGNDAENVPMLAVNTRLGYAPVAWSTSATRRV